MHHVAEDQVVHVRAALGHVFETVGGSENIIVDEVRSMRHLDHEIPNIFHVKIPADPGPLCFPIQPGAQRAVVDIVSDDPDVDRRVELDPADLPAEELMLGRDIEYFVAGDLAEHAAHVPHDAVLAAESWITLFLTMWDPTVSLLHPSCSAFTTDSNWQV